MGAGLGSDVHHGESGEPIVLIHGLRGTRHIWWPVSARRERTLDVLAVNLAGRVGGPNSGLFGAAHFLRPTTTARPTVSGRDRATSSEW